jgi:uncharacterized small protein (DUF1192 family)
MAPSGLRRIPADQEQQERVQARKERVQAGRDAAQS